MSDLQILLISIGVVLIAIVLLYNWWQDWRARRNMREAFPESDNDVLMQGAAQRREPGMWSGGAPTQEDSAEIDPTCEAVIDVVLAQPVSGTELADALQSIRHAGQKPVRVFAEREAGGQRSVLQADESYVSVQLAVLLANRSGPLTAIEWSKLWTQAQHLAGRFEGSLEAPEQEAVLSRAAELDTQCAALDAQVGLILQLAKPCDQARVENAADGAGFVERDGAWVWLADNGLPRFTLQVEWDDHGATHRIDLLLDVPNSMPDDQAFSRMVAVGEDLAKRLNAQVLDDQGRTFQDSSLPAIDQQISALYDQLEQAGFVAGTERAMRVFS